jgi:hypothetical protein
MIYVIIIMGHLFFDAHSAFTMIVLIIAVAICTD